MKSSASLPVKGDLCGRFNGNRDEWFVHLQSPAPETANFGKELRKQSLVQSAFIQGCTVCPWAIKQFHSVCQVSCHLACHCHPLPSPRKAVRGKHGPREIKSSLFSILSQATGEGDNGSSGNKECALLILFPSHTPPQ